MSFPWKDTLIRAQRLRKDSTPAEQALWERLRGRQLLDLKFRRQVPIGPYVADFYCHELRLVLELDGGIHEDERQSRHDGNRDKNLAALGYHVLRFTNEQLSVDPDFVLATIAQFASDHPAPSSPSGRGGPGR